MAHSCIVKMFPLYALSYGGTAAETISRGNQNLKNPFNIHPYFQWIVPMSYNLLWTIEHIIMELLLF